MNLGLLFKRRALHPTVFLFIIGVCVFCIILAAPLPALAQTERPGAVDPAKNYARWPDDEIFVMTPLLPDGDASYSRIYEAAGDLSSLALKEEVQHTAAADQHDAVTAIRGHFLTPEQDSVALAYRNATNLDIRFYGHPAASYSLKNLAPRITGSTDFYAIASGDLDGIPAVEEERADTRDELVVAWAQPQSVTGLLPLQVAVLDFRAATAETPTPVASATASTTGSPVATNVTYAKPYPPHNVVTVATGDFDGNGHQEIAVAYVVAPDTLYIDVFRYTVTRNPATGVVASRSLSVVGRSSVKLDTSGSFAALSAAAGDFDNDGRADLAIATSYYYSPLNRRDVSVRIFRFTGDASLTVSPVRNIILRTGAIDGATGRVELAAGLFKFGANPADGWTANRRQLAVAYRTLPGVVEVRTIELQTDLTATVNPPWQLPAQDPKGGFRLAAGGFRGALRPSDPTWSLALASWQGTNWSLSVFQTAPGAAPVRQSIVESTTTSAVTLGSQIALSAADTDGDTVYLGAPVHFTIEKLISADFILQEPPKHAYWDGKQIQNLSRFDAFNISLLSETGDQTSSDTRNQVSWAAGGSVKASASATAKAGADIGVAKAEASVTTAISATIGYDYQNARASYEKDYKKLGVSFSGKTERDDIIVAREQTLDIWRYRVYGLPTETPGTYPHFDIVLPGPFGTVSMSTMGGGLNYDWYQPVHENGNILSYPRRFKTTGGDNPSIVAPPDMGSFGVDGTVVTELMYPPSEWITGGSSGEQQLTFTQAGETGAEYSASHTLSANASISQSATVTAEAFGTGLTASGELGVELHGNYSWGNNATRSHLTSRTTGIYINQKPIGSIYAYAFYPLIYTTTDGTIKAMFAVDPTKSNVGQEFWRRTYKLPDLALNLPARFYTDQDGNWQVNTFPSRKQMRGFFVRTRTINPVTGDPGYISGDVRDGAIVRLEARVYNYSVGDYATTPAAQACFYKIRFDDANRVELDLLSDPANKIGCYTLPQIASQEMVTAWVEWDTKDASGGNVQEYRIYVRLDPDNLVTETYDTPAGGTEEPEFCVDGTCIDPGQNNEGWGTVRVSLIGRGLPGAVIPDHVGMPEDGVAAIDMQGQIVTGSVHARVNRPLPVRVTITSETRNLDSTYVMLYDGDPDLDGVLIASKRVSTGNTDPDGTSIWVDWVPARLGPHRLYAEVLQSVNDTAPGGNTATLDVLAVAPWGYLPLMTR